MVTSLSQLDPNGSYTYADYLLWKFEERVELLRGRIRKMAAPSRLHQKVSIRLSSAFHLHLENSPCDVYAAPFDVRLKKIENNKEIETVVQPDISVVCDKSKLDSRGCLGAPDLIVEILSPSNSKTEMQDKFDLYREAGVLEYWIANPTEKMIQVFTLNEKGDYIGHAAKFEGDTLHTPIIPNLVVDVTEVFKD